MKKYYFLIIVALIFALVLTGCSLLSNIGQAPVTDQSGITYLTKGLLSDLVGWWRFDGNAFDSSGNGNDGTVNGGATYDASPMGQALTFDGLDDYVNCGSGAILKPTENITIEMWVKPNSAQNQWADILGGHQNNQGYVVQQDSIDSNNYYFAYNNDGTGGGWQGVLIKTKLEPSVWQHFVVQKEGNTIRHFLDGTQTAIGTVSGDIWYDPIEPFYIGIGWLLTSSRYFGGSIDDVRIWDTATPSFNLNVEPKLDFNPVNTEHTVTATVTIDKEVGGTEPAPGVLVDFEVLGVNNSTPSSRVLTDSNGQATFTYTGTNAGKDTIKAKINEAPYAYVSEEVTKDWVVNFVTGGGNIKDGKKTAWNFAGTVGYLLDMTLVGQFQIVNHASKINYHCNNDFSYLVFSGGTAESPMASYNTA